MSRALVCAAMLWCLIAAGAERKVVSPYEREGAPQALNRVDELVLARLAKLGIPPANLCSDEVFLRRVYLDVTGSLPPTLRARTFVLDRREDKRARVIEELLASDGFADYASLKWCDLLRVKAEYPIKLWPNAVQAYHRWIRESLQTNMPCDRFARALLTSSGSNFRVPAVNFYRAAQDHRPETLADVVALTLMGQRTAQWPAERRAALAVFFSRLAFKPTAEWKEEIVHLDAAPAGPLAAVLPDGRKVTIGPDEDPRHVFVDWLLARENPVFARNMANRVWSWLMGRGIVEEPDDFRADNPPSNPELLAFLAGELQRADYDLRHLYRLILNSRTYQQSFIPQSDDPRAEAQFAFYRTRRLDAEVLIDALCAITGSGEEYSSPIPEPFTWVPEHQPTILLADGSITSQFLEMFGRPPRDTGLERERSRKPTADQRMYLLNSSLIQQKIAKSPRLRPLSRVAAHKPDRAVTLLYLSILSRRPTAEELKAADAYWQGSRQSTTQRIEDLAWALINSKEFLYQH
jgi:hypothetical protein